MSKEALDLFGRMLMERVRDEAIDDWGRIFDGRFKDADSACLRQRVSHFSREDMAVVRSLVPRFVDSCLHHLLWTLEQSDHVEITVRTASGVVRDLKQVSDGLAGELYSDEGWIARFSRYGGWERS
jgi:hypothetical protein